MTNAAKFLLAMVVSCAQLIAAADSAFAKGRSGGGSRSTYAGSKHNSSHSGHYSGATGKSHKGGTYKNPRTGNQYGKHKK
jgi:hypothetical protein